MRALNLDIQEHKPQMVTMESKGWAKQDSCNMINEWIRKTGLWEMGLYGLYCSHVLKSDLGIVQFLIPSYEQELLKKTVRRSNHHSAIRGWRVVEDFARKDKLCRNCFQHGHPTKSCINKRRCENCAQEDCEKMDACDSEYLCPHPNCHNEHHPLYRCPNNRKQRVPVKESATNRVPADQHGRFSNSKSQQQKPQQPPTHVHSNHDDVKGTNLFDDDFPALPRSASASASTSAAAPTNPWTRQSQDNNANMQLALEKLSNSCQNDLVN